jgi:glycosyltransferase involved in cell wall biosynthesis
MTLHDYKLVCPSYAMFARGELCYRCRGRRYHRAVTTACAGSRARSALLAAESYWQQWTRVYDRVDRFIAPSEYLRGVMVEAGMAEERIVFVPPLNPATTELASEWPHEPAAADLPARFVAYVGRLSPEKGVHVLLDAMRRTRGITLVIFGDGPEAPALRRAAEDARLDVRFAGHAGRAAIDAALARATAVVLPTLSPENAPMAVLEAANAGVPVIVSNRGGLPELAQRVGGVVVEAGDDDALARAIEDAWHNSARWRERAQRAWQEFSPQHAAGAHVLAIESIYRDVIDARRAA